jgi:hypothetical protein
VPLTRALILAKAVSRLVKVSSLKEKSRSPRRAALFEQNVTRRLQDAMQISLGVSIRGSIGATTPMKHPLLRFQVLATSVRLWRCS